MKDASAVRAAARQKALQLKISFEESQHGNVGAHVFQRNINGYSNMSQHGNVGTNALQRNQYILRHLAG
eukprot:7046904-Karenia_brevis.AAC.1